MTHFQKILVPTDFSETATHALRLAVKLVRHGAGQITLLHVGALAEAAFDFPVYGMPMPQSLAQLRQELMAEREHALKRLAKDEIPDDVCWAPKLREGYAPEEIVDEAKSGHDLLVMGTHGHTGVKHALLGSITERVLRESPVPVLVTH